MKRRNQNSKNFLLPAFLVICSILGISAFILVICKKTSCEKYNVTCTDDEFMFQNACYPKFDSRIDKLQGCWKEVPGGGECTGDKKCNSHGTCENGKCKCYAEWVGPYCDLAAVCDTPTTCINPSNVNLGGDNPDVGWETNGSKTTNWISEYDKNKYDTSEWKINFAVCNKSNTPINFPNTQRLIWLGNIPQNPDTAQACLKTNNTGCNADAVPNNTYPYKDKGKNTKYYASPGCNAFADTSIQSLCPQGT